MLSMLPNEKYVTEQKFQVCKLHHYLQQLITASYLQHLQLHLQFVCEPVIIWQQHRHNSVLWLSITVRYTYLLTYLEQSNFSCCCCCDYYYYTYLTSSFPEHGWLGSRVVSMLDLGTEGPRFKSQSRRCWVTVLGKLFTPIVPLFTKQQNW